MAYEIVMEMASLTCELETYLGPGTSELKMRAGINSGPTTAGLLRGEKSRFQLFGDTVNTAAQMESNSQPGWIMCSQKTADQLKAAGKEHWITARTDLVESKGKGKMQCYWCHPKVDPDLLSNFGSSDSRASTTTDKPLNDECRIAHKKETLLVGWMIQTFEEMLRHILLGRHFEDSTDVSSTQIIMNSIDSVLPREEVMESIALPQQESCSRSMIRSVQTNDGNKIEMMSSIKDQLDMYITEIASLYNSNAFHNFEHACHVVMSTKKLLSRVVQSDHAITETAYGITSDPLTQFAIVFSALVHDVGHQGVSNAQLMKEKSSTAYMYQNKSIAEQNSVTLAWDLLLEPKFDILCYAIMSTECECRRFRQLLVNSVMATDLFDGELRLFRENRWNKAFHSETMAFHEDSDNIKSSLEQSSQNSQSISNEESNRRATIVIEHIIQASDVSHTMQHWKVYQKWNRRLLAEMYKAYSEGRAENDPTIGWYEGELGFFDHYIIPLANKLKTCGVFGVSCDELLDYAMENREEWYNKGQSIVHDYVLATKNICHESSSFLLVSQRESYKELFGLDSHRNYDKEYDTADDDLFIVGFNDDVQ